MLPRRIRRRAAGDCRMANVGYQDCDGDILWETVNCLAALKIGEADGFKKEK